MGCENSITRWKQPGVRLGFGFEAIFARRNHRAEPERQCPMEAREGAQPRRRSKPRADTSLVGGDSGQDAYLSQLVAAPPARLRARGITAADWRSRMAATFRASEEIPG